MNDLDSKIVTAKYYELKEASFLFLGATYFLLGTNYF